MAVVEDLRVRTGAGGEATEILRGVSLTVGRGEVVGLVGESGSGKSTLGLAMLAYTRRGMCITDGRVTVDGHDLTVLAPGELASVRGRVVSYVPQDAGASLNPARTVGRQLSELMEVHRKDLSSDQRRARVGDLLVRVGLTDPHAVLARYPHQLSGGQQQRVGIVAAFACEPRLVVMDEPATGQDVLTQELILDAVRSMCRDSGTAALYISHDLSVVARLADRIAVMYSGELVEVAATAVVVGRPVHPYTRMLTAAVPHLDDDQLPTGIPGHAPEPSHRPAGCSFAPRCSVAEPVCLAERPALTVLTSRSAIDPPLEVRCHLAEAHDSPAELTVVERRPRKQAPAAAQLLLQVSGLRASHGGREVVHGVDLEVAEGHCLALVGGSGSGKSTIARSIAGIHAEQAGLVRFGDEVLAPVARHRSAAQRRAVSYIFQNPSGALNPRRSVFDLLTQPYRALRTERSRQPGSLRGDQERMREAVERSLAAVSLHPRLQHAYPHQLSGGEQQRVAIARALVTEPSLLICDEITASLDVSVQASVLELLHQLQQERRLTLLFITHQLELIPGMATSVAVLKDGHVLEQGPVERVTGAPDHEYTRRLLAAARANEEPWPGLLPGTGETPADAGAQNLS